MESVGWSTVYKIASMRHDTKQGKNPLTKHAHEILEAFCQAEAQDFILRTMGFPQ